MVVAFAGVCAGAYSLVQRDRARLVEQFASERLHQVDETATNARNDLDDIGEDLRFAGELVAEPESPASYQRELRALLHVVTQYKAIAVVDETGEVEAFLSDPAARLPLSTEAIRAAMVETAKLAAQREVGQLVSSPPLQDGEWLRVFATPVPRPGRADPERNDRRRAIAVLVDVEAYFGALRLITTDPNAHVLVLGAFGQPTPGSERSVADAVRSLPKTAARTPQLAELVARMRAGERGTMQLSGAEAQQLGLGNNDVIAAFAPLVPRGGARWALATLTSTAQLQSLERLAVLRLGLAALAVIVLLCAFGAYVLVASRRALALRESQRHAARLAHLHEKAQKILDNIPTAVVALTSDGRINAANRALRDRVGPLPLLAPLEQAFPQAPGHVLQRVRALVDSATGSGQVRTLPGEELALFGEPGHFRIHAVPFENPDPDVSSLLVIEDLSNVHALESKLMRAEKLATVGVLAAGIAHEIGTPLGVVRGRAEYLLGKLQKDAPHAASVQVIVEQIDRVTRTIRQLLDFSRLQPAQVRPLSLAPVARGLVELLQMEAQRRKLTFTARVGDDVPPIAADADQLQQALVNVVMNAFDACAPGGHVELTAEAEGADSPALGRVAIRVRDDGVGIPPGRVNQIFDPFFTTKKRGQGTGLGLTLTAQIARNHGGQVELTSAPGQGTTVTLWWPRSIEREHHVQHG
ncbi:MAG: histidine kinase [Myxococcaceae bacterium]|nr:histidine kinase [Myxococcaceae bacterium]